MQETIRNPEILERMRMAMDLFQSAEEMMRQNLRRRYPQASADEIDRRLLSWLRKGDDPEDLPPVLVRRPGRRLG